MRSMTGRSMTGLTVRHLSALALLTLAHMVLPSASSWAADLPPVKVTDKNRVPACATPGRLMAFLKGRNDKLDPRFDGIATEYMRHGVDLRIRWDIAFFQMILETGNLSFGGDVKPKQNNFAGLGATGKGEPGESFKDISSGVRAHLEHLVMYTGERVANPVAERTRKVQEWGVLTEWQKSIKGPITFAQVARKWAPPARKYAQDIEAITTDFTDGICKGPDPRPQLVAAARKSLLDEATAGKSTPKSPVDRTAQDKPAKPAQAAAPAAAQSTSPATAEAPRATETRARTAAETSTIAAAPPATAPPVAAPPSAPPVVPPAVIPPAKGAEGKAKPTVTVLNPTKAEEPPVPAPAGGPGTESLTAPPAASDGVKVATGPTGKSAVPKSGAKAGKKPKCNVFTASYGGQKSVIIEAVTGESVNYTVLDVNEGSEARETEAYVAAYAKGSKSIGEFKNQTLALDKAFELCPEG
jgi:hypothetical protein